MYAAGVGAVEGGDGGGGEGFCEGFLESTGFGVEEGTGLSVSCGWILVIVSSRHGSCVRTRRAFTMEHEDLEFPRSCR